ncbi:MAG: carboxymuconolactone decarboxylase family protein [Pseudomonadales bacterium]
MSVFQILNDDELDTEAQSVFSEVIDKFQSVPVFYRILAVSPPLLQTYWYSYQKVILEGMLPAAVKELIFLAVARKRRCVYCASVHLALSDIFEIERSTLEGDHE